MEVTALMPEEVFTSFTVCDGYLYFASQALLMTSQSIGHTHNTYYQWTVL